MRADIRPGAVHPGDALPDPTGTVRTLGELHDLTPVHGGDRRVPALTGEGG